MRKASVINPVRDLAMIEARASFAWSSVTRGVGIGGGLGGGACEEIVGKLPSS